MPSAAMVAPEPFDFHNAHDRHDAGMGRVSQALWSVPHVAGSAFRNRTSARLLCERLKSCEPAMEFVVEVIKRKAHRFVRVDDDAVQAPVQALPFAGREEMATADDQDGGKAVLPKR